MIPAFHRSELLRELTRARLLIAQHRFRDMTGRYPEIKSAAIKPLTDDEVIDLALQRELNHQQKVMIDLGLPLREQ